MHKNFLFYLYVLHMHFKHTISVCKNYEPMKNEFHMIFILHYEMQSLWWT